MPCYMNGSSIHVQTNTDPITGIVTTATESVVYCPDRDLVFGFLLGERQQNGTCPRLDPDIAGVGVLSSIIISSITTLLSSIASMVLTDVQRRAKASATLGIYIGALDAFTMSLADQQLITAFAVIISTFAKSNINLKGAHARLSIEICMLCLAGFASTASAYANIPRTKRRTTGIKFCLLLIVVSILHGMSYFVNAESRSYPAYWNLTAIVLFCILPLLLWTTISFRALGDKHQVIAALFNSVPLGVIMLLNWLTNTQFADIVDLNHIRGYDIFVWILMTTCFVGLIGLGLGLFVLGLLVPVIMVCIGEFDGEILNGVFGADGRAWSDMFADEELKKKPDDGDPRPVPSADLRYSTIRPSTGLRIILFVIYEALALTLVIYQRYGRIDRKKNPEICAMRDFVVDDWGSGQALAVLLLIAPFLSFLQAISDARVEATEQKIKPTDTPDVAYHDADGGDSETIDASSTNSYVTATESINISNNGEGPASTEGLTMANESVASAFNADFPHGFEIIETDGGNLLCGLRAVIHTLESTHPDLPRPNLQDLLNLFQSSDFQEFQKQFGLSNHNNLHLDQIGAVLQFWGEAFHGLPLRVGGIIQDGDTFLVPFNGTRTPHIVWIHNAPVSAASSEKTELTRHFSGVRPRTAASASNRKNRNGVIDAVPTALVKPAAIRSILRDRKMFSNGHTKRHDEAESIPMEDLAVEQNPQKPGSKPSSVRFALEKNQTHVMKG